VFVRTAPTHRDTKTGRLRAAFFVIVDDHTSLLRRNKLAALSARNQDVTLPQVAGILPSLTLHFFVRAVLL
jgi:hypothetical protein